MWAAPPAPHPSRPGRAPGAAPEPDVHNVAEHVHRAADRHHLRRRRVPPDDWHLSDANAFLLGQVQHLGVVAEAVRGQAGEDLARDVAAEKLETALGIPDSRQEHGLDDEVEDLAHEDAIDRLRDLDARALDRARPDGGPGALRE